VLLPGRLIAFVTIGRLDREDRHFERNTENVGRVSKLTRCLELENSSGPGGGRARRQDCWGLERLYCFKPKITDAGVKQLADLTGLKKLWDWGDPPTFGSVGSGKFAIFLCEGGQGGRGKSELTTHDRWACWWMVSIPITASFSSSE